MNKLDDYDLKIELYSGKHSKVFSGTRKSDGGDVIVKMHASEFPNKSEVNRFICDYEIGSKINSEFVAKYYDLIPVTYGYVIIKEDFCAQSLAKYIHSQKLDIHRFLTIAIQLASCLKTIHSQDIIHKCITTNNILVNTDSLNVKIIDFSIASHIPKEIPYFIPPEAITGELAYISPEQTGRMNRSLDYRSDFYSLGISLYEYLTKEVPFKGENSMEIVHNHIAREPITPFKHNNKIPKQVSNIILKLLAKSPDDRYQSAYGLLVDLETCQKQLNVSGRIDQFILGRSDNPERLNIPEQLYGRETEHKILLDVFEKVSHGSAEVILVSGYSGIGKSALVRDIHKPVTMRHGYYINGKFDRLNKNIAYSAIVQAFKKLIQHLLSEDSLKVSKWREILLSAVAPNGQVIIEMIPELEHLIGKQPSVPDLGPTETRNRFHLTFLKIIKSIANHDHPLVMFLDDLQWADIASLNLIKTIILDEEVKHFLLIGAYRSNEVDTTHPMMMTFSDIRKLGITIHDIVLSPLDLININQLLADTLACSKEHTSSFGDLIRTKTEGNPFFVKTFLQTLYDNHLLKYNHSSNSMKNIDTQSTWNWDLKEIESTQVTTNVANLFVSKISDLPKATTDVLKIGASLGNTFSISKLATITEQKPEEMSSLLQPALVSGVLTQIDQQFLFVHDRVQEATYSLISDDSRQSVHLNIGRLLSKQTDISEDHDAHLQDVVTHMNIGRELITNSIERISLAEMNLSVGNRAKDSAAYDVAKRHFSIGIDLLPKKTWSQYYKLTYELYLAAAETEFLEGDFVRSENLIKILLKNTKTPLEKCDVYVLHINKCSFISKYVEAINTGREALTQLGAKFPHIDENLPISLESLFIEINKNLGDRLVESLIDLPKVEDPIVGAQIKLLSALLPITYYVHPGLLAFCTGSIVNLSIQNGNAPTSASGYSFFAVIQVAQGNYSLGHEFGKVALELAMQYEYGPQIAMACHMFTACINHWRRPLQDNLNYTQKGYETGVNSGDLQWSTYTRYPLSITHLYLGTNLKEFLDILENGYRISKNAQNEIMCQVLKPLRQFALNLSGKTANPKSMDTENFKEELFLKESQTIALMSIPWFYGLMAKILYMQENYKGALEYSIKSEQSLEYCPGQLINFDVLLYQGLSKLALISDNYNEKEDLLYQELEGLRKEIKKWADNCPDNFLCLYLLLEAEVAGVQNRPMEAMDLYEKAIDSSQQNKFIHNEALCSELYAKFLLTMGRKKFAAIYMHEAYRLYELWGAIAKVNQLNKKYGSVLFLVPTKQGDQRNYFHQKSADNNNVVTAGTEPMDVITILKASQAISSEINLEKLLTKMMAIIIENAGAQRGYLICKTGTDIQIKASAEMKTESTKVLDKIDQNKYCKGIVNYVLQSGEKVILGNASQNGQFVEDTYISKYKIQSVLCTPFQYRDQMYGTLYLENNLVPQAFTEKHIALLKALLSQAAISMENAELFGERTRLTAILEATSDFVSTATPDGKLTYINRAGKKMLGWKPDDDLNNRTIPDAHPEWAFDLVKKKGIPEAIAKGIWQGETALLKKDGTEIPASQVIMSHKSGDGEIAYFSTIIRDISERKMAEQELQQLRNYLSNIINSMPSGLVGVDIDGKITQWNKTVEQNTGVNANNAHGKYLYDIMPRMKSEMEKITRSIRTKKIIQQQKKSNHTKNGISYEDITIYPLITNGAEGAVIRIDEVTEQVRMEEMMIQSEKMLSVGGLAAGMAHEINNPLAGIIQTANNLANRISKKSNISANIKAAKSAGTSMEVIDDYMTTRGIPRMVASIINSGKQVADIVNNMLSFSRKSDAQTSTYDLTNLLDKSLELAATDYNLKKQYDFKMIKIHREYEDNLPNIICEGSMIQQVLLNILRNGAQAMHEAQTKNPQFSIRTRNDRKRKMVCIEIEDNGPGMDEETRKRIFEPFFTTKPVGVGTGLGLSVSYFIIVENHNGELLVDSRSGFGTKFSIYLP